MCLVRRLSPLVIASVVVTLTSPAKAGHYLLNPAKAEHDLLSPAEAGRDLQDAQTPTFRTEANYVRVDVYPTANGAPVVDLRQEDFEVLEDGVPLRDLAFATDGLAIVATNDLEAGLRRVTADLSSYYLLAYYSTGKFDGKFHAVRVRVKRPSAGSRCPELVVPRLGSGRP